MLILPCDWLVSPIFLGLQHWGRDNGKPPGRTFHSRWEAFRGAGEELQHELLLASLSQHENYKLTKDREKCNHWPSILSHCLKVEPSSTSEGWIKAGNTHQQYLSDWPPQQWTAGGRMRNCWVLLTLEESSWLGVVETGNPASWLQQLEELLLLGWEGRQGEPWFKHLGSNIIDFLTERVDFLTERFTFPYSKQNSPLLSKFHRFSRLLLSHLLFFFRTISEGFEWLGFLRIIPIVSLEQGSAKLLMLSCQNSISLLSSRVLYTSL